MILAASDLKLVDASAVAVASDAIPSTAASTTAASSAIGKPSAKPGADERDVVVLTVQKPVKAGSRVS